MSLLLSCLRFRNENILMNLDLFFSLLHGHFKLIFSILETVDSISLHINSVSKLLNLQFLAVVLNKGLLLDGLNMGEIVGGHLIFKLELLDLCLKIASLFLYFVDNSLNVSLFID